VSSNLFDLYAVTMYTPENCDFAILQFFTNSLFDNVFAKLDVYHKISAKKYNFHEVWPKSQLGMTHHLKCRPSQA